MGSFVEAHGLSSCGSRVPESIGSVVVAHGLSCPEACGITLDRDQTRVPCIGRLILNRWTSREVRIPVFLTC